MTTETFSPDKKYSEAIVFQNLLNQFAECNRRYNLAINLLSDVKDSDFSKIGAVSIIKNKIESFLESENK